MMAIINKMQIHDNKMMDIYNNEENSSMIEI